MDGMFGAAPASATHGSDMADAMVTQDPRVLGEIQKDIVGHTGKREADKAYRALVKHRRQWRDARDRVAGAFSRIDQQRRAMELAVRDYEALQRSGGNAGWISGVVLEKIKARAKALDRVTGDMIHKARLAEDRKEQLYRAWRKHEERRRQRERERGMRDLGL